jgi:hypothetical protein
MSLVMDSQYCDDKNTKASIRNIQYGRKEYQNSKKEIPEMGPSSLVTIRQQFRMLFENFE